MWIRLTRDLFEFIYSSRHFSHQLVLRLLKVFGVIFWSQIILIGYHFITEDKHHKRVTCTKTCHVYFPFNLFCDHDRVLRAFSFHFYTGFNLYRSKILEEGLIPTTCPSPRSCWSPPPPNFPGRPCSQLERQVASIDLLLF